MIELKLNLVEFDMVQEAAERELLAVENDMRMLHIEIGRDDPSFSLRYHRLEQYRDNMRRFVNRLAEAAKGGEENG